MQSGVISSKAIGQYNRMDARFHLAVKSVEESGDLDRVKAKYPTDADVATVVGLLSSPTKLKAAEPLARGQTVRVDAVVKEYPHLFLAIALKIARESGELQQANEEADAAVNRAAALKAVLGG